jgi:hypothetical protein
MIVTDEKVSKPKPQEPFRAENELLVLAMMHVDTLLERIRIRKLKAFEPSLITQLCKLSTKEIKILNHQYAKTCEDLKAALAGDTFFIEAYSNYDKAQMKLTLALFKGIKALKHDDAAKGRFNNGSRKRKEKTPGQIVKKVLFLEKDNETGIFSLKPAELVGAIKLWVYNVKVRKLGCYVAKSDAGLSAKGTTILNYDEKQSTTKTIRKPKIQINEFIEKTPSEMQKYWDSIRAVPQEISPRLSRDSIILRTLH